MKEICISIDLDPLSCYYDIHGIEIPENKIQNVVYTKALERIYNFFVGINIKPTLFVVGRELNDERTVSSLKDAISMGYEIANHSYSHLYNLSLLPENIIEEEIEGCHKIIGDRLGVRPIGFRAPGYNMHPHFIRLITNMEYRYDSSILPSPFYYFLKCAVIGFYRLIGRKTKSICGSIKMPFAERRIYPMGPDLYSRAVRYSSILEIPISVAGRLGIPFIGTFIMGSKNILYNYLKKKAKLQDFLHIELHGLDFIDRDDVKDDRLCKAQFDINIPLRIKLDRLKSFIDEFKPDRVKRLSDFRLQDYVFV
ncbi:MAG: polysaccharide deacetylase family protein [Deltaproteobacteria bacterium]|nr:polysaccharide deacetylase family protein [Deltaproteobacteria bacterium]